jgi:hypothetical protein
VSSDIAFSVSSLDETALATYLQAHEAGSRAAEGMAKRLVDANDLDTAAKAVLRTFIVEIRVERAHLTSLLERLDRDESLMHRGFQAAAMVADMAGKVAAMASPKPLSELEALAVGVWGKRLLWGALRELAAIDERIAELPLDALTEQAERQEVEMLRLRSDTVLRSLTSRPS